MRFKDYLITEENVRGIHVRDTWVNYNDVDKLEESTKKQIYSLIDEYKKLNYIDVRTELGPSQIIRMSAKQRSDISNTSSKVFAIEMKIKHLMKPKEQKNQEEKDKRTKEINGKLLQLKRHNETIFGLKRMAYKNNGKLKTSYQRAVDDNDLNIKKLEEELKAL